MRYPVMTEKHLSLLLAQSPPFWLFVHEGGTRN